MYVGQTGKKQQLHFICKVTVKHSSSIQCYSQKTITKHITTIQRTANAYIGLQGDIVRTGDVMLHVLGGEEVEQTEQHASQEKQPVDTAVTLTHTVATVNIVKLTQVNTW